MKDGYIKLQVEQMMPEEYAPTVITINSPKWDMDCFKLLETFHGIAMAMTYSDVTFKNAMIEYLAAYYDIDVAESDEDDS